MFFDRFLMIKYLTKIWKTSNYFINFIVKII